MTDFFLRTEDIRPEEIIDYFVESKQDRVIINSLKNRNPAILIGSRGVGKSFLLRVAQKELSDNFEKDRVFPVYLSFVRSSLLISTDPEQFKHWMLAKICSAVARALMKAGLVGAGSRVTSLLARTGAIAEEADTQSRIEQVAEAYENSWKLPARDIDASSVPSIDDLKETFEDLSEILKIERFALFIDEAAHIFLPEQQRQFFTLFRDLRSHCVTCNAAVYPGVTSFGDTFQPVHDATMLMVEREILSPQYVENMREIVEKQADSGILKSIVQNGRNFSILAYAASGNPRLLLKTLSAAPKVNSSQINEAVRDYYRTDIWSEHSALAEKYIGHREVIDWGRQFIESTVLPDIKSKNDVSMPLDKSTSAYFWIHRDSPEIVKEALRILSYTGVVTEQATGIKASRGEVGTRYIVNLGCLFALEQYPASTGFEIAQGLAVKRMTEFGANHPTYRSIVNHAATFVVQSGAGALEVQLKKPISVLDLSDWQKGKLTELALDTVGDVLGATEQKLKEAFYVGNVRARRMRNAAVAAVLEYLSG
jgi:hypothetical protein